MRLFGLIGYPLGHSFSEGYFKEKFENEHISDCEYRNFPIESIDKIHNVLEENPQLIGLNVTIPYKRKIISFLDELYPPANKIEAVNTIKIETTSGIPGKILKGYNTDVYGFTTSLKGVLKENIDKALILGTGGAALAVEHALTEMGISSRKVSRNSSENFLGYEQLDEKIMNDYLLIVNTTPLGTYPDFDTAPDIPYNFLGSSHILFDLVYNPSETLFMKKGKEKGARVKNGYEMLVGQAEKSWEIWNV